MSEELEDISEEAANLGEIVAAAFDNPYMAEHTKLTSQIRKLRNLQKSHAREQKEFQRTLQRNAQIIPTLKKRIENAKADLADRTETAKDKFRVKLGDTVYTKRPDAEKAFKDIMKGFKHSVSTKIGEIAGFDIKMAADLSGTKFTIQLVNHNAYQVQTPSVASMEYVTAHSPEKILVENEEKLHQANEAEKEANKQIGKSFKEQDELDKALAQLDEINERISALSNPENSVKVGEEQNSETNLPEGYKTESGRSIQEADTQEFILKPDGNRDFGQIDEKIVDAANEKMEQDNSDFRFEVAPIRLQVGIEDIIDENGEKIDGFGYKHILKNFNQVRKSVEKENRIIFCCKGDKSKGLMPVDLELEKGEDNFYTIVTAYPRRKTKKEDTLLLDVRPTNTPTDAASVPHLQDSNNKDGVASRRDIAESNVSSGDNITQTQEQDKGKTTSQEKFEIGEFTHTKTGEKIPSAKLNDRVERDEYLKLNAIAKKHGGSYSKFAKTFLFKTAEGRDSFVQEVADQKAGTKFFGKGDLQKLFNAAKILTADKLNSAQKKWSEFGEKIGLKVVWIDAHSDLKGATENGTIYLNAKNFDKNLSKTFYHEIFHILSTLNPELHGDLMKHFTGTDDFTKEQLDKYRKDMKREDLSDDKVIEEILCDNFSQVQKRVALMQNMAKDNPSLLKRFVSFVKYLADKFVSSFHNPEGGMTTSQRDIFIKGFNSIAKNLKDAQGKPLFKTYKDGKILKFADGTNLPQTSLRFDGEQSIATDEEYLQTVEEYQNAKTDSERQRVYEKLQNMVMQAAKAAGFENAVPEQTSAYKVRTKAAPKKTIKVYKVFTVANDGSPTALFVGGTEKLPQNVWLDAQDAWHFTAENGSEYVPSTQNPYTKGGKTGKAVVIPNDKIRQELIKRGFLPEGSKATKVTALAYRPGWHAGTLPFFPQGGMKRAGSNYDNIHRYNQVVFECELAAEKDYTKEAETQPKARNKDGSLNTRKADLQYLPDNGFYYYATNPKTHGHPELGMWVISGSLKINRALTQEECDKILAENGKLPQEWEQGKLNLADLGYTGEQNDAARKTLAPVTYDDDGKVIPLSKGLDATRDDIRFSFAGEKAKTADKDTLTMASVDRNTKVTDTGTVEIQKVLAEAFTETGRLKNPKAARDAIAERLTPYQIIQIINKETGIAAKFAQNGVKKVFSTKAVKKSLANGFTEKQHFEAALNIKELFENAETVDTKGDINNQLDVLSIKYFNSDTVVSGEKAVARIMAKETIEHGHRIYTIELQQLNKPVELKNRTGTDSPTGSKGSTHRSYIADSRNAEEPSAENIPQSANTGKEKNSDEIISDALKNDKTGSLKNFMEQAAGGKIVDGKAIFPDEKSKQVVLNHLKNIAEGKLSLSVAWHGSPHDFDNFDLGAIGTGEGAQVHGWGLYFAKYQSVAETYRNMLGKNGKIYRAEIPDENVLLDEQKTLAKQSETIQKTFRKIYNERGITFHKKNTGEKIYKQLSEELGGDKEASKFLNEYGIKGIVYEYGSGGINYVVFDDQAIKILEKFDMNNREGINLNDIFEKIIGSEELTDFHKTLKDFAEQFGVTVVFFRSNKELHGGFGNNTIYLNVNSEKSLVDVLWHEAGHLMKAHNLKMYQAVINAANITKAQIEDFKKRTGRTNLTDDEVREEIFADAMREVAKRAELLNGVGRKDKNLAERVVAWIQKFLSKLKEYFRNPTGKLTTAQYNRMADAFGNAARNIVDVNGRKIFRYNKNTHTVEPANGEKLENLVDDEENLRDNAENYLTSEQKQTLSDTLKQHIENHISERLAAGDSESEIVRELNSENSRHRARILGKIAASLRNLENHKNDKEFKRLAVERVHKSSGWSDKAIDIAYKKMIDHLKESVDYGGVLYREIALDRRANDGQRDRLLLRTWQDAERRIAELEGGIGFGRNREENEINNGRVGENRRAFNFDGALKNRGNYNAAIQFGTRVENGHLIFDNKADEDAFLNHLRNKKNTDGLKLSAGNENSDNNATQEYFDGIKQKFIRAISRVLHPDGERIVTTEVAEKRKREQDIQVMDEYIKDPSKENRKRLKERGINLSQVEAHKNGADYQDYLTLQDFLRRSPSRISEKVPVFKMFFRWGDGAMHKLVSCRNSFEKGYSKAMDLVKDKEDTEKLFEILWTGDRERKEFTREELLREGIKENVADAYLQIRRLITKAYHMVNEAYRRPQHLSKYLSESEIKILKENKFAVNVHEHGTFDEKGNQLVSWKEYANREQDYLVNGATLKRFKADESMQVISEEEKPNGLFKVVVREGLPPVGKLKGYIPHFFHHYVVQVRGKDGKEVGGIIGSCTTEREAVQLAEEWKKTHTPEDGEEIYIAPKSFDFKELGVDEDAYAPIMGDKDFATMIKNIAEKNDITLAQAKKLVNGTVRLKNRHRFFGNILHRTGATGYVEDMNRVLRHYFNTVSRYAAI